MQDLTIEAEQLQGGSGLLLRCHGFADAHTFELLDEAIGDALKRGGGRVVVDLSDVAYMSSAGLGILIKSNSEAEEAGGGFVLLNPSSQISELLDDTGLTGLIPVAKTVQEAVAQLGAG